MTDSAYTAPAATPTQEGPDGLRFDFNLGARVAVPAGDWRVELRDLDTGNTLFQSTSGDVLVSSAKRYFVRFAVIAWHDGAEVLRHHFDAAGREVLIQFPVGTLGDVIGWLPYAVRFQQAHRCRLTVSMGEKLIGLFAGAYPEIRFVTQAAVVAEDYYATYHLGLFFNDDAAEWQPSDFRLVGLHRTAGYILGVDPAEAPPLLDLPATTPPIAEPYVVIATQSSTQCKYWNNPTGWREVVARLRGLGYRVVCIDQAPVHGHGIVWNHIPHRAEDETGDRPLAERARWLRHAAFFVGLSSGLSWLAWAVGTPVVMISGFTHPTNEFATPYRVINYNVCNSCWNDPRLRFNHHDFLWCPRFAGSDRQFECSRLITAAQVLATIGRIPDVQARIAARPEAEPV